MEAKPQAPPGTINMELGEKEAEGIYSNFVVISHSLSEFVLDFARVLPGNPKSKVFARVVMTPPNVRSLLAALEINVKKYEDQFGKIKSFEQPSKDIGFTT
ncbi:MAG TPA: DUF3467 domain-containing protein [Candidatus Limnocylindrales bacterium]|jgi:uncharacterized protein DUF3467|nr:DUF3467 domain-containing protein [Candidatus Limnocylindrales bacterium]